MCKQKFCRLAKQTSIANAYDNDDKKKSLKFETSFELSKKNDAIHASDSKKWFRVGRFVFVSKNETGFANDVLWPQNVNKTKDNFNYFNVTKWSMNDNY